MSSNSVQIIHQIHRDFQELVEYVTGEESRSRTAYEVELTLFRQLLKLGLQLLRLFFVQRASVRPRESIHASDGTPLKYHDMRQTTYFSVFGKVQFQRHYFHAPGQEGICPLDAQLSLPPRCYSDLLRDWAEYCITDESYNESVRVLKRILGLSVSKLALETTVQDDAADVEAFYKQKDVPPPETEGSILVVQADGKGVPMMGDESAAQPARRGKGQKRTKKKEAVVTAIYTIQPYRRTPQEVVEALLGDFTDDRGVKPTPTSQSQRPAPIGKEVRATLEGKDTAFDRLAERVAQREGKHTQQRVALTDGDEALQNQAHDRLSKFNPVLDIIHASEYLWDAANAVLGETHPDRTAWVGEQLLYMLSGKTTALIQTLESMAHDSSLSPPQRQALNKSVGYYQRNLPYMRYDRYLARGWPIGTGVVEGACGHLVKDRMEQSGMRWMQTGAQAILDLRSVRINDDWDGYQRFRRQRQHQRLYGSYPAGPPLAETIVLEQVA
jgi:hypothetical protein